MRGGRVLTKRAQMLRRASTDTERLLWRALRQGQLGWRFRRQFPIPPYVVDFACIEARLIIEADGGQHALPGEHDRRDAVLKAKGWRVLRFWNNDVIENRDGVLQRIAETLETSPDRRLSGYSAAALSAGSMPSARR
jgi:very-short-patch-repair endonuclease